MERLKDLFKQNAKHQQYTWCYCPSCKQDLVSQDDAFLGHDMDGLVVFQCTCREVSRWLFDTPVPMLVSDHETVSC